jgi:hypothetical protein
MQGETTMQKETTMKEETMQGVRCFLTFALVGAGAVMLPAASVSAAVVCKGNVCWHTKEEYRYPPEARVVIHPDDWRWGRREHYRWREHEGAGYWRGNRWIEIER